MKTWLRGFGPSMGAVGTVDFLRAVPGLALALLLTSLLVQASTEGLAVHMIPPFGATALLVFFMPNSPVSQPWPVVMGNTVSGLVALALLQVFPPSPGLEAAAVALSLLAMLLLRALHPPSGAVALLCILIPDAVQAEGLRFVLDPVALGSALIVLVAVGWHRLTGRVYPYRQPDTPGAHGTADPPPAERLGLEAEDLSDILARFRQTTNLGVADLARLVAAVEETQAARLVPAATAATIMSRDLVTVGPDTGRDEMAATFAARRFDSLPVLAPAGEFLGLVEPLDLVAAPPDATAATLMRKGTASANPDTPLLALIRLLGDSGAEAAPVLDGARLVGLVTRSDLISILLRSLTAMQAVPPQVSPPADTGSFPQGRYHRSGGNG